MDQNVKKELEFIAIGLLAIIVVVIPILLGVYNTKAPSLGFWGSYLGGIIGMVAVVGTTFVMIRNQNKHFKHQLEEQRKQHHEQLLTQKDSILKQVDLNDKKERDRIYFEFLARQNEEILEDLLKLNILNNRRFNYIRDLTGLSDLKNEIIKKLNSESLEEQKRNDFKKIGNRYNEEMDLLKDKETEIRNEILLLLARTSIKSEYFEKSYERFRVFKKYQEKIMEIFHLHIANEDITSTEMYKLIEKVTDENLEKTNNIIGEFTEQLKRNTNKFRLH